MRNLTLTYIFSLIALGLFGDVTLPNHFSDKMVIQQNSKNLFWGWAEPNEKVSISTSWCGVVKHTFADSEGNWSLLIGTPEYQKNQKITVKGNNTIIINDVSIGEVWLAVGQSNMGWGVDKTFNSAQEKSEALAYDISFYIAPKDSSRTPDLIQEGTWVSVSSAETVNIPAVSFHYAKKLYENLGIPIGIIIEAYAGTRIETWMPLDIQMEDQNLLDYVNGVSKDKRNYYLWIQRRQDDYNSDPVKYRKFKHYVDNPVPFEANYKYPGTVFNAMINPIIGYGIKGMIYYQGEENSGDMSLVHNYSSQLPKLINYYRQIWSEKSEGNVSDLFPFYFVQLPSFKANQEFPVENDTWPYLRDVMTQVSNNVANTGRAITIDTGDEILLHPQNKKPIGVRLAYLALKNDYSKNIVSQGPDYSGYSISGTDVTITFETQGATIVAVRPNEDINSFAVAGSDKVWHWADNVQILGNTIIVSSSEVSEPISVRYTWAQNPSQRNLIYNNYGLPASPFRTDDWEIPSEELRPDKPKKPTGYEPVDWYRPEMTQ